jgi:hypothetical protein
MELSNRTIVEDYFFDLNSLAELLAKLTNSYRLMIGGAEELNTVALATKKDVKNAINRANELGEIIDRLIITIDKAGDSCNQYCKLKNEVLEARLNIKYIENEMEEELKK